MRRLLTSLLCVFGFVSPALSVEFIVHPPATTPDNARIYLSGNIAELGNWKPDAVKLERNANGTFHVQLAIPAGTKIEFKATRGSWDRVEKDAAGEDIGNRSLTIESETQTLDITVATWGELRQTVVGTLKLHAFQSKSLESSRTLRVWLPAEYESHPDARYPVLYQLDGQACFDVSTSAFGREWQIDETLTDLIGHGKIPPMIVVGVDNMSANRINEYTFAVDAKRGGGGGERHMAFLTDEVIPFINQTYRTQEGRSHTFLGGASLGGLVSLEIATRHPETFGGVIAMSPSIWWADRAIVRHLEQNASQLEKTRIWIDMGTAEGSADDAASNVKDARQVDAVLTAHHVEHHLEIAEGAEHNESAWAKRFPEAIQYLVKN